MTDSQPTLDRYSVQEVAERLGVGATTIKTWAATLGIEGHRNTSGKRYFTPEQLRVLETVKALRDQDAGMETITRVVSQPPDTHRPADGQVSGGHPIPDGEPQSGDLLPVVQELNRTVQEVNRLALLLTQAGQENERLRGDVLNAERRLIEAEGRETTKNAEAIRLSEEVEAIKARLADEIQVRIRIEAERDTLQAQAIRPWWRKLIGG